MKTKSTLLMIALVTFSITARAQTWNIGSPTASNVTATLSGGTLTISGTGAMANYANESSQPWASQRTSITAVVINGITNIGNYAFVSFSGLTSVTIGNSVTSIGNSAFSYCTGLTSVSIPNSVTTIGWAAFYGCSDLTTLTIGNLVTTIGNNAFSDCIRLTSVTIPNSVTSIGSSAFSGCRDLTSLTIGNSVTSIGNSAFSYSGLTSVNFNATNCTFMGSNSTISVFNGCTRLTQVNIGSNVTTIPSFAFRYCSGLTSVTIPNSVTSIGDQTFANCSSLTTVTIGNLVTSIGNSAFSYCSSLTTVTIGNSVTAIGEFAFYYCTGLTSVNFNATNCTSMGPSVFYNCTNLTHVNIGNGVIVIPDYAFSGCSGLTSVTVQWTTPLNNISSNAFSGCSTNFVRLIVPSGTANAYSTANVWKDFFIEGATPLPSGICGANGNNLTWTYNPVTSTLTISGTGAISGSPWYDFRNKIRTLILPNNITSIGDQAFFYCTGLTSITIPYSVTSIGNYAFSGCSGLTTVNFNATNCTYMSSVSYNSQVFRNCTKLSTVNIGSGVTRIPDYAFYGCSGLTSVTVQWATPLNNISSNAFSGCSTNCVRLIVPSGTANAYSTANVWKDFYIEGISSMPTGSCGANLTWAYNPVTLTHSISGTGAMTDYWDYSPFNNFINKLRTLVLSNNMTTIGSYAFHSCSGLTSVTIPNSVTSIGNSAFRVCSSLTSVTIGNSVTSIGNFAFSVCSSLTSVTIGNSVTSIGEYAFNACSDFISVTNLRSTPQWINYTVFHDLRNATLRVPNKSTPSYQSASVWSSFGQILRIEDVMVMVTFDPHNGVDSTEEYVYFNETVVAPSNPTKIGYTFDGWYKDGAKWNFSTRVTENMTLAAVWIPAVYTITYVLSGGNHAGNPAAYTIESPTITLQDPTRAGYTFTGWAEGSSIATGSTGDKTFTAQWEIINYSITYVLNDGTNHANNPATYTVASPTITLQNPTRAGYTFAGWQEGNSIAAGSTGNKTFTAVWNTPVTAITNIPAEAIIGVPLALTGIVTPSNATHQTIVWSVVNAGGTGAIIIDNIFNATSCGTATVRATIVNGLAQETNYTQDFQITVKNIPVSKITVPTTVTIGVPLPLTGTVEPNDATYKTIEWKVQSAGTTGAFIDGSNMLYVVATGTALITASIAKGDAACADYTQQIFMTATDKFIPVTNITGVPTTATAGAPLTLAGTVTPADATNQIIVWSVLSAGTTSATITGNTLHTTASGTVTVRATIAGGATATTNYTQDFTITVNAGFVAVTGISGVAATATAGTPLTLTGTVAPTNATNKTIAWSVLNAGTTGATIVGATLNTTASGTVTVRATIANGATATTDYAQNFTISVTKQQVTGVETSDAPLARIYPNPTDGTLTLEFEADGDYNLTLADMSGKILLRQTVNGQRVQVDMGNYPSGVYLLTIDDGKRQSTTRVVKN